MRRAILSLLSIVFATLTALAQSYSIAWHKISSGGGTSANGNYSVTGTIGQADAGNVLSAGNYSVTGGFWSVISLVQTAGAPTLYISNVGGMVTVYWQNVSGWTLRQNSDLTQTGNWSVSAGVTASNGTNFLQVASPSGNLFFRLSNP